MRRVGGSSPRFGVSSLQSRHVIPTLLVVLLLVVPPMADCFHVVFMAKGGRKKSLKRRLDLEDDESKKTRKTATPVSPVQEITGVTLPEEGKIKGWEFGENQRIACARVEGVYYAVDGTCPRCGFDLYRGTVVTETSSPKQEWDDLPRVACPTCCTTFSLRTGQHGPPLSKGGWAGMVGNLAQTATANDGGATKNARAFVITTDEEEGRVYCQGL